MTTVPSLITVPPAPDAPPPLRKAGGWPVLDPAALSGIAGEIVRLLAPHTEADIAGLLVSFLVEVGALIGSGPHAVADSAEHPARLFAVLVGETSKGRKGSAEANVRRVVDAVDSQFVRDRRLNGFGSGEALVDAAKGDDEGNPDRRLLVLEPEFARILNVARRDGSTISTIIRQGWDGGRLAVRSRSGISVVDGAHVCVLGHITADELRAKLTETEVAAGFANRFLFTCVRRSKLLPAGGNLDDAIVSRFGLKLGAVVSKARKVGIVRRTPEAEALWADLYYQMADDEPGGLLGAVIGRDAAQTLRLSVLYALLAGSSRIELAHVEAAFALWSYCRASAAYIFGESIGDPISDRLLQAVRDAGPDGLTGTAARDLFARHATRAQIEVARTLLVRRGLIELDNFETDGRPVTVMRSTLMSQGRFGRNATAVSEMTNGCDISDISDLQGESDLGHSSPASCDISDISDITIFPVDGATWTKLGERVEALSPDCPPILELNRLGWLERNDLTIEEIAYVHGLIDEWEATRGE